MSRPLTEYRHPAPEAPVRDALAIVTGGRGLTPSRAAVAKALSDVNCVLVGDANGVDAAVIAYCNREIVRCHVFRADWETHGKAAGPIRNREMVEAAKGRAGRVVCVAFPGGKGTRDCSRQAEKAGIEVRRVA